MKLHLLIGTLLVFGIPILSVGMEKLFPEETITAGCAAAGGPLKLPSCGRCDPFTCYVPPGGHKVATGFFSQLTTCIEWDGIYPPHCLHTPTDQYDLYDADWEDLGNCMEQRCAQSTGSNPPPCTNGYHP